jgi:hypothetical protein
MRPNVVIFPERPWKFPAVDLRDPDASGKFFPQHP